MADLSSSIPSNLLLSISQSLLSILDAHSIARISHLSLRRYGREVKLMLGDRLTPPPQPHSMLVQGLQRALKKALIWNDSLLSGKTASLAKIAQQENVTQRYIAQMIRLAYLAPDIQEGIIKGKIPPTWTVDQFREVIPLDWEQQRLKFCLQYAG